LFASESLARALRQLEVYGRDGLPVISADGRRVEGWITSATVLRALARQLADTGEAVVESEASTDRGRCDDTGAMLRQRPTPGPERPEHRRPDSVRGGKDLPGPHAGGGLAWPRITR
jgi:hypothetical protein